MGAWLGLSDPGQSFPERLEQRLNESPPKAGAAYDVLNFSVTGYGVRDQAAVLEHKAIPLGLRLVLLEYRLNDADLGDAETLRSIYRPAAWWQRLASGRRAAAELTDMRAWWRTEGDVFELFHSAGSPEWNSVVASFEKIREVAGRAGAQVVVVIVPSGPAQSWRQYLYGHLHAQVGDLAQRNGFVTIDLLATFSQRPTEEWGLSGSPTAPSAAAHELASKVVFESLAGLLADAED